MQSFVSYSSGDWNRRAATLASIFYFVTSKFLSSKTSMRNKLFYNLNTQR